MHAPLLLHLPILLDWSAVQIGKQAGTGTGIEILYSANAGVRSESKRTTSSAPHPLSTTLAWDCLYPAAVGEADEGDGDGEDVLTHILPVLAAIVDLEEIEEMEEMERVEAEAGTALESQVENSLPALDQLTDRTIGGELFCRLLIVAVLVAQKAEVLIQQARELELCERSKDRAEGLCPCPDRSNRLSLDGFIGFCNTARHVCSLLAKMLERRSGDLSSALTSTHPSLRDQTRVGEETETEAVAWVDEVALRVVFAIPEDHVLPALTIPPSLSSTGTGLETGTGTGSRSYLECLADLLSVASGIMSAFETEAHKPSPVTIHLDRLRHGHQHGHDKADTDVDIDVNTVSVVLSSVEDLDSAVSDLVLKLCSLI